MPPCRAGIIPWGIEEAMKIFILVITAVFALAVANPVLAADLPARMPAKAPMTAPVPYFSWTACRRPRRWRLGTG